MFSGSPSGTRTGKGDVSGFMDTLQPCFPYKHRGCIVCSQQCCLCDRLRGLRDRGETSAFGQRSGKHASDGGGSM